MKSTALALALALAASAAQAQNTSCKASKAAFDNLQSGMSVREAEQIIGCAGELLSETDMAGYRTVMLMWTGSGGFGANMNAMFQNDAMISKSQFGLR